MRLDLLWARVGRDNSGRPPRSHPDAHHRLCNVPAVTIGHPRDAGNGIAFASEVLCERIWVAEARKPMLRVSARRGQEQILGEPQAVSSETVVSTQSALVHRLEQGSNVLERGPIFKGLAVACNTP